MHSQYIAMIPWFLVLSWSQSWYGYQADLFVECRPELTCTRKSVIYTTAFLFTHPLHFHSHGGMMVHATSCFSDSRHRKLEFLTPLVTLRSMWQSTRIHTQTRRANLGRLPGITLVSECVPWVVPVVRNACWDVSMRIKHTQWVLKTSEHIKSRTFSGFSHLHMQCCFWRRLGWPQYIRAARQVDSESAGDSGEVELMAKRNMQVHTVGARD